MNENEKNKLKINKLREDDDFKLKEYEQHKEKYYNDQNIDNLDIHNDTKKAHKNYKTIFRSDLNTKYGN